MNKRMREILNSMDVLKNEAEKFKTDKKFDEARARLEEIEDLKKEYEVEKGLFETDMAKVPDETGEVGGAGSDETKEEKAFSNFVTGRSKELSMGNNGAVIPKTIASKIIEQVKELSPIYSKCSIYNVKGDLAIPSYGKDGSSDISAAYQGDEFTELTAGAGKFTAITLGSNAVGSLALISKQFINNTDVNVVSFTQAKIAKAFAEFIEKELLVGTGETGHMTGATKTTNLNTLTAATLATITADVLIDTQLMVPEVYQQNACWIMNKEIFKAVRKFKDSNGDYIMTKDYPQGFGWLLLGKPVYISENMPAVAAGSVPVLYGDFSGMACKLSKDVEIQLLLEKYATQNAIGIVGWAEIDSKIENEQKFVGIQMKPTAG